MWWYAVPIAMYGIVTRNADELEWAAFDRGFYEVKDVTGRRADPVTTGVNMVSVHGDTRASEDPDLVPVSQTGERATRDQPYFDWGYVCPTHESYRDDVLAVIERCGARAGAVRLDDVGFPRPEYCYCNRCSTAFAESPFDDRIEWRESVITAFVAAARKRVPGELFLTLYPDPYPGHLSRRAGLDPEALAAYVDEFVVPIYDLAYSTTYWIEGIASGFADEVSIPFSIELYAVHVDPENLQHAAAVADAYAQDVYFAYDAETARSVIQRLTDTDEPTS